MKKFIYTLFLITIMVLVGCNDDKEEPGYPDEQLEEVCNQINSNITALQALVDILHDNDLITSISPLIEDDKEVGYTFAFAINKPISIYYGNSSTSPSIGIKQDSDSIYYWTLNDGWLLDSNSNKVMPYGSEFAVLPTLKIEKKNWYVSLDNGKSWINLGQGNNVLFSDIDMSDAEKVVFTLSNGEKLIIPRQPELTITFNIDDVDNNIPVEPNATIRVAYTIMGETKGLNVEVVTSGKIKAEIEDAESAKGTITIQTGETIGELDKLILIASNGSTSVSKSLSFEEDEFIHITSEAFYNVENEGATIEFTIETNTDYSVSIPEDAQGWISEVTSRAIRQETITLNISPNNDVTRTTKVYLTNIDGITLAMIQISQEGQSLNTEIPSNMQSAFPDVLFRRYVLEDLDTNHDGTLSKEEALAVTTLDVSKRSIYTIKSLEGIQYFSNLKVLNCSNNEITTLNLSENKALTSLNCENNLIASLDISDCAELTELKCRTNEIPYLNLSKCAALTYLDCSANNLTTLDLSYCPALTTLSCSCYLTSLDLSNCPRLTDLDCYGNDLITLNLACCPELTSVKCYNNRLISIDLSNSKALTYLDCSDNLIGTLNLSNCPALTELECYGNHLTSLNLSNNPALTSLSCSGNRLNSLDVSKCQALTSLSCSNNKLYSLNVSNCTALKSLWCESNLLTSLKIPNCPELTQILCADNQILSLNLANCPSLTYLNCHKNMLISLDSSHCPEITYFDCSYNDITSLDISQNTKITELHCYHNELTELDLSPLTTLTHLYCYDNKLTSVNFTKNTALADIDCSENQLTTLDLSNNTELYMMNCNGNQLTTLDLSKNTELTDLWCVMPSLKTLYLKTGFRINGININRGIEYISSKTEIKYID
ncbi:MAG: hypothetical protein K2H44_05005 [Muribaculaceae bacterium]|nr:hypothetical protein [Muribaculaceae bacterium]